MYYCPKCKRAIASSNNPAISTARCSWCGTVVSFADSTACDKNDINKNNKANVFSVSIVGKCTVCGTDNPGNNRYCNGCGVSLCEACPACQEENRIGLRFCGKCGIDISNRKKSDHLKREISKALEEAYSKRENLLMSAEILLNAANLEDTLTDILASENVNSPDLIIHNTLNSLLDEKTIESFVFPSSGTKEIEFLCRVAEKLPDRKDIRLKIDELCSELEKLLIILRQSLNDCNYKTLIELAEKSRWNDSPKVATIVFDAKEKLSKLSESKLNELINGKKYFELNNVLAEFKGSRLPNKDIELLFSKTTVKIQHSKQLFEKAFSLCSLKKQKQAIPILEMLLDSCSDYPDANRLLDECRLHLSHRLSHLRKLKMISLLLLSLFIIIFMAFLFIKHTQAKVYKSYLEATELALSNRDFDMALTLCNKALNTPGCHYDNALKELMKEAQSGLDMKSQFETLISKGNQFLEKKDWMSAEKEFRSALTIPGYKDDMAAIEFIKTARANLENQKTKTDILWNETKLKVKELLFNAGNNYQDNLEKIKTLNIAMDRLQNISDAENSLYLSDSAKTEIDSIKTEIIALKSKLVKIPYGFDLLKEPVSDSNGWASEIKHKATGVEMVYVAPGEFIMGSLLSDTNRQKDEIQHKVILTKEYYIGKYEVTQEQWETVMGNNPSSFKNCNNAPVDNVSWNDCQLFCTTLDKRFRLPTEAEWEYAARGGSKSKGYIFSGSNNLDEVGWHDGNCGHKINPVGMKKPNEIGLYDMSGNVWEWCADWHVEFTTGIAVDPVGACSGADRIGRGGSWINSASYCRLSYRSWSPPDKTRNSQGLRLAMNAGAFEDVLSTNDSKEAYGLDKHSKLESPSKVQQLGVTNNCPADLKIPEIGMEFIWIKTLNLWVGKYEVTNGEYRKFKPEHTSKYFNGISLNGERQPVVYVNFADAREYAVWLTEQEREKNLLPAGYAFRLPTKDEWIAFCQCGDNREYPWGNTVTPKYGNYHGIEGAGAWPKMSAYNDRFPVTCPVDNSGKNDWGLYGVGGNVWECTIKSQTDLSFDAWRGAAWSVDYPSGLHSISRNEKSPSIRSYDYGFRLVLSKSY